MVKVVTESISDLPQELVSEFEITIIPYYINYGGQTYKDDISFDRGEFYRWLRISKEVPKTSHPNLEDLLEVFSSLASSYEGAIYLTVPAKLTSTLDHIEEVRRHLPGFRLEVYEGGVGIGRLGLLAVEAARLARQGASLKEILEALNRANARAGFLGVLETLEYLARGGRIGKAQALLGSVFKVKPILTYDLEEGVVVPVAKATTQRQAVEWAVRRVKVEMGHHRAAGLSCVIDHADVQALSEEVRHRLLEEVPGARVWQVLMSPVVGAHLGPGAWAISWMVEEEARW